MNVSNPVSIVSFLAVCMVFLLMGCGDTLQEDSVYDEALINQHMETEVTFEEPYRPQYHYTPKINWMNDPNGLVYHEGTYHIFHQYNPFGHRWGFMSWNHAVSEDLVHWEHQLAVWK